MSFQYACFISYRKHPPTEAFVDRLANALRDELKMLLLGEENQIFRDNDYLCIGDDINSELAEAICKSVCYLIVYVPNTFQSDHPYCAREYAAMCDFEEERLAGHDTVLLPNKGPILTLPYRGSPERLPTELQDRGTYEFGAYKDLANDTDLQDLPASIAKDIAEWCDLFAQLLPSPGRACDGIPLPPVSSAKANTIIEQQANCGFRFPNQGG